MGGTPPKMVWWEKTLLWIGAIGIAIAAALTSPLSATADKAAKQKGSADVTIRLEAPSEEPPDVPMSTLPDAKLHKL